MSVRRKFDRPKLQLHHGPVEIERKFLVTNDDWRQLAVRSVRLRDGLIAAYKDCKVRVRIAGDDIATVAIKGPRIGVAQAGLPTPRGCSDHLEKERFFVENAGGTCMSRFRAVFSKAWLLPKSSSSTRARN